MSDFRYQVQQLQKLEENKTCIDCGAPNPQWASVSFGTYFCLECSGQHRSLGVHISFVRSVSMDSWKEEQYKKMKAGGNRKAREFFKTYGIDGLPIRQKYHTKAADLYREKLSAELDGRSFDVPPPSDDLKVPNMPNQNLPSAGQSVTGAPAGIIPDKKRNEQFFQSKHLENESRPENLHPSQGGKYQGFGSSYTPPSSKEEDVLGDALTSLSKGWGFLSQKATEVAKIAAEQTGKVANELTENVIKPTTQKVQDPALRQNVSATLTSFGASFLSTADKGFSYLANAFLNEEGENNMNTQAVPTSAEHDVLADPDEVQQPPRQPEVQQTPSQPAQTVTTKAEQAPAQTTKDNGWEMDDEWNEL